MKQSRPVKKRFLIKVMLVINMDDREIRFAYGASRPPLPIPQHEGLFLPAYTADVSEMNDNQQQQLTEP